MKKQKQLLIARGIFVFIVFVALGVIVVTEKANTIIIPKVKIKMEDHINKNYNEIKNSINLEKINYNTSNKEFTMKVTSKKNKNHFFYIKYSNHKIKDTYKNDYLKGEKLLNHIQKKLKKEIEEKTNSKCNIKILTTLNNFTNTIQNRIINEENLLNLKFYTIEKEILINNWNQKEISEKISEKIKEYEENNITPKNYTIIITNKKDITESIKIINITNKFIDNPLKEEIINDIINNENSKIIKQNKITFKYLN